MHVSKVILEVFNLSRNVNLLNELCKEVSFVIWSFFIARTLDTFKGIFTLQEREELDRIVKENYKDKSD